MFAQRLFKKNATIFLTSGKEVMSTLLVNLK